MSNLYTTTIFIEKALEVHGDLFNYSRVNYINSRHKVEIVCKEHGIFLQEPRIHLQGFGCKRCKVAKSRLTNEEFIEKANIVHNFKYNYSKINYNNSKNSINIICTEHGIFKQVANNHLQGFGCKHCASDKRRKIPKEIENLVNRLRSSIKKYIRKNKVNCKHKTHEILGLDWLGVKKHLDNNPYGLTTEDKDVDIDHIVPLSKATNAEEVYKLNHYTNLQLLPSFYNQHIKRDNDWDVSHFEEWMKTFKNEKKLHNNK